MTKVTESIKRKVRVVIEREIEIELTPEMFGEMSIEEYLAEFSNGLWDIDSVDDLAKYAARVVAYNDASSTEEEGLGLVGPRHQKYPRVPDVKFDVVYEECEEEILDAEEQHG